MNRLQAKDDARVEKPDGQVLGPYKSIFAGSTIVINDAMADVEPGDTILRRLPNGKDERSIVTEAVFYSQGVGPIGAHYQIKFKKGGESLMQKPTQHINISGAQSVQIGDYNTQNIVNSFDALVKMIDSSNASPSEKAEAKSLIRQVLEHPLVVTVVGAVAGSIAG